MEVKLADSKMRPYKKEKLTSADQKPEMKPLRVTLV